MFSAVFLFVVTNVIANKKRPGHRGLGVSILQELNKKKQLH
ncbi:hypothetical protein JCM19233_1059 [Vibrio astriarenae]|nr:hypothetical protein JCM19233_1059 [Vibrio sp. C7]